MERHLELIRSLLFEIEQGPIDGVMSSELDIPGYSSEQIAYHVRLLHEDGYLTGVENNLSGQLPAYLALRLTSKGHDFADAAKSSKAWEFTKLGLKETGGWTLAMARLLLEQKLKEMLGLGACA